MPAQNRCLVNAWSILEIHCWHVAELIYTCRADTEEMAVKPPLPHSNQMLGRKLETKEGIFNHLRNTWLLGPLGVAGACPQTYLKDDSAGSFFMTCSRRVNKPLFPSHTKLLKQKRDTGGRSERLRGAKFHLVKDCCLGALRLGLCWLDGGGKHGDTSRLPGCPPALPGSRIPQDSCSLRTE